MAVSLVGCGCAKGFAIGTAADGILVYASLIIKAVRQAFLGYLGRDR